MKIITLHSDFIEIEAIQKAIKDAEPEAKGKKLSMKECLVVFAAVEKDDTEKTAKSTAEEIRKVAEQVKTKNILLYPWVHITSTPSSPATALAVLKAVEKNLSKDYQVERAPFGWYKSFNVKVKGHPLAELSRTIVDKTDNSTYKKLIKFLDENGAHYRLIDHPPEGRTEIVSPMRGNKLSQAAKCMIVIVKTAKNQKKYILAVVSGDAKVDLDAIKKIFDGEYASFATPEIAEELAGSVSGTVLPFSFNPQLELIVDPKLLENEEIFFNAARLDQSMALKTADYIKLTKPCRENIASFEEDVSQALKAEDELKSYWYVLDLDGKLHEVKTQDGKITGYNFSKHENLEKFFKYEIAKDRTFKKEPEHIKYMHDLELLDYEPASDPGNLRWYPKGRLVKSLLERYVSDEMVKNGAMEIESPIMYDYEHPALKSYMNRFPARQYTIQTPDKKVFLRFAACFGQFIMAHDANISYKNMPMWLYELTRYSFRVEKRGELSALRRQRAFTMPDCHAFVMDIKQAKQEMLKRFEIAWKMQQKFGFKVPEELEFAVRFTKEFWEQNKDFIAQLVKRWGKPAMIEMWDKRFFYFSLKYEWNFVDAYGKASALTTDQFDVENAERYGIQYTGEDGKKRFPIILHLSPSGGLERLLYAVLEKQYIESLKGKKQQLPLWLSPTQIRLVPVSNDQIGYCEELSKKFRNVRVDIDDRNDTLGKKIRNGELEWIPYIIAIGQKEMSSNKFPVRIRETGKQVEMSVEQLQKEISEKTEGMPFRDLPLPKLVSKRPIFVG